MLKDDTTRPLVVMVTVPGWGLGFRSHSTSVWWRALSRVLYYVNKGRAIKVYAVHVFPDWNTFETLVDILSLFQAYKTFLKVALLQSEETSVKMYVFPQHQSFSILSVKVIKPPDVLRLASDTVSDRGCKCKPRPLKEQIRCLTTFSHG